MLAHGGRTGLVQITVGDAQPQTALLKTYTRDAKSGQLLHLDFQAVRMNETVSSTVPVHFVGEPPAVRQGGVLVHSMSEVKIEALVRDLPEAIEVDLSGLEAFHDAVKVADITPPQGVTLLDPPEEVVAVVLPPTIEEEVVEAAPEAAEEGERAAAEGAPAAAEGTDTEAESS